MNFVRIVLAVLLGMVLGSVVNMGILMVGAAVVPPPAGADMTTAEGIAAAMPMLEAKHFLFPFLAHAFGTFVGALAGATVAWGHRLRVVTVIGCIFLAGGIAAVITIPAPIWFIVMDLSVAYIPTAWLALNLANHMRPVAPT